MASPYVPLDKATKQIRLLVLSPSLHPDDERIQCQICIESNFEAVSFEALSYMWGDPDTAGNKVWLNNTLVDVRVNLYNALSYLRTNLERVLWIDALCINQDDVKERNHQVSFMGLVYEKATRVLVWLGLPLETNQNQNPAAITRPIHLWGEILPLSTTRAPAFDLLKLIADSMIRRPTTNLTGRDHFLREPFRLPGLPSEAITSLAWFHHWFQSVVANSELLGHWQDLHDMLLLPYWKRLWIIQEIILAKDILLVRGRETCHWSCLTSLFNLEKEYSNLEKEHRKYRHDRRMEPPNMLAEHVYNDFPTLVESNQWMDGIIKSCARNLWVHKTFRTTLKTKPLLYDFLSDFEESLCHDPRDKIYGFLGLLDEAVGDKILIDYSRPLLELWGNVLRKGLLRSVVAPEHYNNLDAAELLQRAFLKSFGSSTPVLWNPFANMPYQAILTTLHDRRFRLNGTILGGVTLVENFRLPLMEEGIQRHYWVRAEANFLPQHSDRRLFPDVEVIERRKKSLRDTTRKITRDLLFSSRSDTPSFSAYQDIGPAFKTLTDGDLLCKLKGSPIMVVIRPIHTEPLTFKRRPHAHQKEAKYIVICRAFDKDVAPTPAKLKGVEQL